MLRTERGLRKELRRPLPLADLQALHKWEVKTKAELQMTWPSVEECPNNTASVRRPEEYFFSLFSFFLFWLQAFKKTQS